MSATRTRAAAEREAEARRALARIDRRHFLALGFAVAGASLLPTGCGGVPADLQPPPGTVLRQIPARAYATCTAAAQRLAGPAAARSIAQRQIDVGLAVDRWVEREPGLAGSVGLALRALEWGIPPLIPKWRPFTAQTPADQDRILRALMHARLDISRDIFRGVRSLVFVTVYGDPVGVRLTGFPGPLGSSAAGISDAMTYDIES